MITLMKTNGFLQEKLLNTLSTLSGTVKVNYLRKIPVVRCPTLEEQVAIKYAKSGGVAAQFAKQD